jgi:hypothetical protein
MSDDWQLLLDGEEAFQFTCAGPTSAWEGARATWPPAVLHFLHLEAERPSLFGEKRVSHGSVNRTRAFFFFLRTFSHIRDTNHARRHFALRPKQAPDTRRCQDGQSDLSRCVCGGAAATFFFPMPPAALSFFFSWSVDTGQRVHPTHPPIPSHLTGDTGDEPSTTGARGEAGVQVRAAFVGGFPEENSPGQLAACRERATRIGASKKGWRGRGASLLPARRV